MQYRNREAIREKHKQIFRNQRCRMHAGEFQSKSQALYCIVKLIKSLHAVGERVLRREEPHCECAAAAGVPTLMNSWLRAVLFSGSGQCVYWNSTASSARCLCTSWICQSVSSRSMKSRNSTRNRPRRISGNVLSAKTRHACQYIRFTHYDKRVLLFSRSWCIVRCLVTLTDTNTPEFLTDLTYIAIVSCLLTQRLTCTLSAVL